ncbi:hypothetical protein AB0D04_13590 [Streptomyces sp. NPDC048483]|uniref:hypothetical protein n=1 Tax=Streptomyces sp. NPDC048483 TaxID=3154927 RepID=UPI00341752BE
MDEHKRRTPDKPRARERAPWYLKLLAGVPALCFLSFVLIGLRSASFDQQTIPVYVSGSRPSVRTESHSSGRNPYTGEDTTFAWDVSQRAGTTFRPREGDGTITVLTGMLETSLPPGCGGKSLKWSLAADGRTIDRGTNHYRRTMTHTINHHFSRTPRVITLTASWNGGTAPCTAFQLTWRYATLFKDPPWFWEPAFYSFGD